MNNHDNMSDGDVDFLRSIKCALESDAVASSDCHRVIREFAVAESQKRQKMMWRKRVCSLIAVAAGVAILLGAWIFINGVTTVSNFEIDDLQLVQDIELLDDSEELKRDEVDGMDTVEVLLAWQDAPYNKVEDEFSAM